MIKPFGPIEDPTDAGSPTGSPAGVTNGATNGALPALGAGAAPSGAAPPPDPCASPHAGRLRERLVRLNRLVADGLFALLLAATVVLAGWLVARHDRVWDWTSSARNSLSAESLAVLDRLAEPLHITVYGPPTGPLARAIEQGLLPYQRATPSLVVTWVDPALFPEQARAAGVRLTGQLVLTYQGRRESLGKLDEATLTNAIARLTLADPPRVVVLEGHGERVIAGAAGSDLGRFAQLLHQRGFRLQPLDLSVATRIPDNTDLVLATAPAVVLFPGAVEALLDYLARGGNLLWLLDPPVGADAAPGRVDLLGYEALAEALGLVVLPGQVVDAAAAGLGLDSPTLAVVRDWPDHPLTAALGAASVGAAGARAPARLAAVFPGSLAFAAGAAPDWHLAAVLATGAQSWNETGPIAGEIGRDELAGEVEGPLAVALLLSRPRPAAADHPAPPVAAAMADPAIAPASDPESAPAAALPSDPTSDPASDRAAGAAPLRDEPLLDRPLPPAAGPGEPDDAAIDPAGAPLPAPVGREQQVIVVGDGDFVSNAHIATGANQALALRMARWLSGREDLVAIPPPPGDREPLLLDPTRAQVVTGVALVGLPLAFALIGLGLRWWRGRR